MDYEKKMQSRRINNIYALKVLNTDGNRIVVRNALDILTCISIIVSDNYYEPGTYVDVAFSEKDRIFNAKLVGITPPEFVPDSGIEIY